MRAGTGTPFQERIYTVSELARAWGISKSMMYELLQTVFADFGFGRTLHPRIDTTKDYKRKYTSCIRIPESVALRMWEAFTKGTLTVRETEADRRLRRLRQEQARAKAVGT